ncbi:sporulation kinase E [Desulfosporosinus acididurans]|uniref:histidine kinase n=1 Tax=Desulfosporosinus acididurans TaxID=476652 RepID=A0A0J1IG14_9FIRM|nr:PAS domain-containing sensor histidine kinase [Desulfosporosinus acididurans]KLU63681.1 sporulation kinase E [Desulfosporosinus acididurans]
MNSLDNNTNLQKVLVKSQISDTFLDEFSKENISDLVFLARKLKKRNVELEQSKELFYNIVENMMDCVTVFSAIRNNDGKIVDFTLDYINQAACKNANKSREELIGHSLLAFSYDVAKAGLFDAYCKVVETNLPFSRESIYYNTDNKNVQGAYDNRTIKMGDGVVVIYRNITEKKQLEIDNLRTSEERFSKVFYYSPLMMSIISKYSHQYIAVNRRFLEIRGLLLEDVIGKTPPQLGIPESEFEEVINLLQKNGLVDNFEGSMIAKNSSKGTVLLSAQQIQLGDQECILISYNDITELKKIQSDIARLDRFNLIGQMAAGIGHEIRNPLTVVKGYLQLMGSKPELEPHFSKIETMISEIDRANSIITEFLSLAKHKSSELQNQNINSILLNLYPLLQADTFTQNKQIVLATQPTPYILLDYKETSQLILNLFRNGLEAMHENGTLTIRTYVEDVHVVLAIQDEGPGIPLEYIDKLGTPFFTTKDTGTGLGLATCYSIAERHQAKIRVESSPCGTNFMVYFPIPQTK